VGTLKIPELKQYIFRKLGHPVINVEIDDTQLDDCIDEALKTFIESHYDACDIGYLEIQVLAGEREYTLADSVEGVLECLNTESLWIEDEPLLLLRPTALSEPTEYYDVVSTEVYRQRIQLFNDVFKTWILFEFNDITKKLTFPSAPNRNQTRVLKIVQAAVDTNETKLVLDSLWLKKYSVALARIQWGVNLGKYEGAQLPGGVTINFAGIIEKGESDKEALLTELEEKYTLPPDPVFA
jgi:hypothetical protein